MKSKIPIIILFVVISICITIFTWRNTKSEDTNDVTTKAVVTNVYSAKISKHGLKPAKYDIRFLDKNGKEQKVFRVELGNDYQPNDTVQISYNPENMSDVKPVSSN